MINWISVEDRLPSRADSHLGIGMDLCYVHIEYTNGLGELKDANSYDWYDDEHGKWQEHDGEVKHWVYARDLPFPT